VLKSLAMVAAAATAFVSVPAMAQQGDAMVSSAFSQFETMHPTYTPVGQFGTDMAEDGTSYFAFRARAGVEYFVLGACDAACSDIDVEIFSGNTSVASDFEPDDFPMVSFTAETTGLYTVELTMPVCSAQSCWAGGKAYAK